MTTLSNRVKLLLIFLLLVGAGFIFFKKPLNLGLDLKGGMYLILEAKDSDSQVVNDDAISRVMAVIRNRIDSLGVTEPVIQRKGRRQISVELPGIKDPDRARAMIGETALLEFVNAEWAPKNTQSLPTEKIRLLAGRDDYRLGELVVSGEAGNDEHMPLFLYESVLTGKDLKNAFPTTDEYGNAEVGIEFKGEGADVFRKVTSERTGKPLAILLDGKVISAPRINTPIMDGKATISGKFSPEEVRDLVVKLRAGALPVPIEIVSEKLVGPTLGQDSIEKSMRAGIIGTIIVVTFMLLIYRIPGLMANLALISYAIFVVAILKLIGATLTLPGVAGFILTIGMAVDANVIIYERIKEERANGSGTLAAIDAGFKRAFQTILDANIANLVSAIVLFWLGTGSIKGFAVILTIGILVSMFTAVFVTRVLLDSSAKSTWFATRFNEQLFLKSKA